MPGPLDFPGHSSLVFRASSHSAPGYNSPPVADKSSKSDCIKVGRFTFLGTKLAHSFRATALFVLLTFFIIGYLAGLFYLYFFSSLILNWQADFGLYLTNNRHTRSYLNIASACGQ